MWRSINTLYIYIYIYFISRDIIQPGRKISQSTDDIEPETSQQGQEVFRLFLANEARRRRLGHIWVDAKKCAFV